MDVRSHPCESRERHCSAGAGPDRLEKGVAWADLLDERSIDYRGDRRNIECAIRKRIRSMKEGND